MFCCISMQSDKRRIGHGAFPFLRQMGLTFTDVDQELIHLLGFSQEARNPFREWRENNPNPPWEYRRLYRSQ